MSRQEVLPSSNMEKIRRSILFLLICQGALGVYAQTTQETKIKADRGDAKAQYELGVCYAKGNGVVGVVKNSVEAVKWYRIAAEQGDAAAQFALGVRYTFGDGVPKDNAEAVKWYRKAAEQGDADAQFATGGCYRCGAGVVKDYVEGFKWYFKAADQGNAKAQLVLGRCYRDGDGVAKDYVEAYAWYNLSGANGSTVAAQERNILERTFPACIVDGQKRSRELAAAIAAKKPSSRNSVGISK